MTHRKKHREKHEEKHREKHREKHEEKYEEKHEDHLIENHDEKTWRLFDFDKESWRENMIESHEEKSHQQNHKREKVDISWFLLTFSELAVNLMCQLMIKISWFSQLLADY